MVNEGHVLWQSHQLITLTENSLYLTQLWDIKDFWSYKRKRWYMENYNKRRNENRCLLKVLCPVSRPITTLDCVLLKDNNRALVARSGPKINSWACLCVLQGPRHNTRCWSSNQRFIFLLIFCLETPQARLQFNEPLNRTVPCELVGDFISSHSGTSGDPIQPQSMSGRYSHALPYTDNCKIY